MTFTQQFDFISQLCDFARETALIYFRTPLDVEHKNPEQPVTIADRTIEQRMRTAIEAAYPLDGIFGEEFGKKPSQSGRTWVLDPIDGTKAFITGMPTFACLVALYDEGQGVIQAAIEMPGLGERWLAGKGQGSYWHTRDAKAPKPCQVRQAAALGDCLLTSTTYDMFQGADRQAYESLCQQVSGRRFGGDAYGFGLMAAGFFDFVVEADLQAYDYLAPSLVIQEAGGVMTDWQGQELGLSSDGRVLAAGSPSRHAEALKILSR